MATNCIECGCEISPERLEVLPNTETCTQHSSEMKKAGIILEDDIVIVERKTFELINSYQNDPELL